MKSVIVSLALLITSVAAVPCIHALADTKDTQFESQMKAAGFPTSYLDSLSALHKKYPNWQFEAVSTGLNWDDVIKNESKNGVNLVPKSGNDSTKSTASGAYDQYVDNLRRILVGGSEFNLYRVLYGSAQFLK